MTDEIQQVDEVVKRVAEQLPFPVELTADMGGTSVLQINLGLPTDLSDNPYDRAGIDPGPHETWWFETAAGETVVSFDGDATTDPATIAQWITARALEHQSPAVHDDPALRAIATCQVERGALDLHRIAELLDMSPDKAAVRIQNDVFRDPETQQLVPAPAYFAGDLNAKLAAAEAAHREAPVYGPNIWHLEQILEARRTPAEIAQLGLAPAAGAVQSRHAATPPTHMSSAPSAENDRGR